MPLNNYNDLPLNLDNLSKEVVDCAFQVHKKLGPGFLEKNYEEAFCIELNKKNIPFERQKIFKIPYGDQFLNSPYTSSTDLCLFKCIKITIGFSH
jgi:GxxExxY protein